jgi:hypothetical protein
MVRALPAMVRPRTLTNWKGVKGSCQEKRRVLSVPALQKHAARQIGFSALDS